MNKIVLTLAVLAVCFSCKKEEEKSSEEAPSLHKTWSENYNVYNGVKETYPENPGDCLSKLQFNADGSYRAWLKSCNELDDYNLGYLIIGDSITLMKNWIGSSDTSKNTYLMELSTDTLKLTLGYSDGTISKSVYSSN